MTRHAPTVLRILVTAGLLVVFAVWVDLAVVVDALAEADGRWFAVGAGLYVIGHLTNGLSWRHLLGDVGVPVSLGEMARHDLASVFWSTVVPGGVAGEVVKGVRIARARGDGPTVATAIVAARLVGGTSAGLLGLVLLPWSQTAASRGLVAATVLGGIVLAGVAGLAVLARFPDRVARWIPRGRFPSPAAIARAGVATGLAHLCFAATTAACFTAAGHPLSLADATWVSVATSLVELAPVTVGGFGVRELTVTWLGGALVPPAAAASAALLTTAAFLGVVVAGGVSELLRSVSPPR